MSFSQSRIGGNDWKRMKSCACCIYMVEHTIARCVSTFCLTVLCLFAYGSSFRNYRLGRTNTKTVIRDICFWSRLHARSVISSSFLHIDQRIYGKSYTFIMDFLAFHPDFYCRICIVPTCQVFVLQLMFNKILICV